MGVVEPYQLFERRWAEFNNTEYAVACSTGTAALHLALVAIGVKKGDEVIVPEFTMVACANAVAYTGATPVFVDCDETLNIDPSLIEKKITKRTKAIMVAHIYGKLCDMEWILAIAKRHGLWVIEDAAEAHGATKFKSHMAGAMGHIGCFSHYKNKIIAAEEGGSCITRNLHLAERMRALRSHAFDDGHTFLHTELAFNYRMTNDTASRLLSQDWEALVQERKNKDGSVNWVFPIICETQFDRDLQFQTAVEDGENPRLFFKPMSMQPMYLGDYKKLKAYDYSCRGFYIPWKKN